MRFSKLFLAVCGLALVSGVAQAKDPTDGQSGSIAVENMLCGQLYVAHNGAGAAYTTGVDVNGKPVAPADLPAAASPAIAVPDYIEVPLTVNLAEKLSQPLPAGAEMKGVVGNLRLYKSGKVEYNGQDLTPKVTTLCSAKSPSHPEAIIPAPVPAPLDPADQPIMGEGAAPTLTAPAPENTLISPDVPIPGAVAPSMTENPKPPKSSFDIPRKTVNVSR